MEKVQEPMIMEEFMLDCAVFSYEMYQDKSPEYWSGWALAYYQWYTGKTFSKIHAALLYRYKFEKDTEVYRIITK